MVIDKTFFIGEITIAQLSQPSVADSLTLFINKREPEYLVKALGYPFAQLFNAGIADANGRWFDLKSGAEYPDKDGYIRKWQGFTTIGISPVANYIYYFFERDNITFTSGSGEASARNENSTGVSIGPKLARAWNEMVNQTKTLHDFLKYKVDGSGNPVYPEFDKCQTDKDVTRILIGSILGL